MAFSKGHMIKVMNFLRLIIKKFIQKLIILPIIIKKITINLINHRHILTRQHFKVTHFKPMGLPIKNLGEVVEN